MLKRTLMAAALGIAFTAPVRALDVQLFPLTGEVRFHNIDPTAVAFVYYSITSNTSGALNPSSSAWKSITENYDAPTGPTPGNGFIDATHEWTKLSATTTELTEGVFTGPGGSLPAFRSVSLGSAWNPNVVPYSNLAFDVRQPDGQQIAVNVKRALDGDYNGDLVVDAADYTIWRQNFGSTTALDADGNLNGIVDSADYTVWRANFGKFVSGSSLLLQAGSVPEPGAVTLVFIAAIGIISAARLRRVA